MASGPQRKTENSSPSGAYLRISSAVMKPCSKPAFSSSDRTWTTLNFGHTRASSSSSPRKRMLSSSREPKSSVSSKSSTPSTSARAMDRKGVMPEPPARPTTCFASRRSS